MAEQLTKEIIGAGGVVFSPAGKVLVLQHASGDWIFPKGHLDAGETALEAALREVEEEAGVHASCPTPDVICHTQYVNDRGEARLVHWFPLLADQARVDLREALFVDGCFLDADDAFARLSYPQDHELLLTMLEWWAHYQAVPGGSA